MTPPRDAGGDTDDAVQPVASAEETWELRLFVTGRTPTCVRALANLRRACAHWLPGQYHIEIIDLMENPRRAAGDQVVAVPTLVRMHPQPTSQDRRRPHRHRAPARRHAATAR